VEKQKEGRGASEDGEKGGLGMKKRGPFTRESKESTLCDKEGLMTVHPRIWKRGHPIEEIHPLNHSSTEG